MSGSGDYTQTPNLGLYMPVYDMDDGNWGFHLNDNAQTLDSAISALQTSVGTGGPFLPLAPGGTVSGSLTVQYAGTSNRLTSAPTHPSAAYVAGANQLFSYFVCAADGGNTGDVVSNANFYSSITGAPNTYVYNILAVTDYSGSGGSSQQVPVYMQGIRRTHNAGGAPNNPQIWGAVMELVDMTGTDSAQTNALSGLEIDMTCGNGDSANNRRAIGIYLNQAGQSSVAPTCNLGIHVAANQGSYNQIIKLQAPFNYAALDLRNSAAVTGGAHTIWLQDGGDIAWTTAGNVRSYYDPTVFGSGGLHITSALEADNGIYTPSVLVVGGGTALSGTLTLSALRASTTYANDAAAATGGVAVGQLYRNGSVVQIRVT